MKDGHVFYKESVEFENDYAFAIKDGYPVSEGHYLVIPKRKTNNVFNLSSLEIVSCFNLVRSVMAYCSNELDVTDFNIGMNLGPNAGQTVDQLHIHVIPRREGDVKNPEGGVRGVIPDKRHYQCKDFSVGSKVLWNEDILGTIVDLTVDCDMDVCYEIRFPDHTNHKDIICTEDELTNV